MGLKFSTTIAKSKRQGIAEFQTKEFDNGTVLVAGVGYGCFMMREPHQIEDWVAQQEENAAAGETAGLDGDWVRFAHAMRDYAKDNGLL